MQEPARTGNLEEQGRNQMCRLLNNLQTQRFGYRLRKKMCCVFSIVYKHVSTLGAWVLP